VATMASVRWTQQRPARWRSVRHVDGGSRGANVTGIFPAGFDPDGASDSEGLFGLPIDATTAKVQVIPVPFEATASYRRGTAAAPSAVVEASWQVDLHDSHFGDVWREGIAMLPERDEIARANRAACRLAEPVIAAGGGAEGEFHSSCAQVDELMEGVHTIVRDETRGIMERGAIPAVFGGDHSVPLGAIREVAAKVPELGILHVDAHADLRTAYEGFRYSHASIFDNVLRDCEIRSLVQVGIRDLSGAERALGVSDRRIRQHLWSETAEQTSEGRPWMAICNDWVSELPESIWISLDVDGLDPGLCPNTGTPVPGGFSWDQLMALLLSVYRAGKCVVGFDISEASGEPWDSIVAARLLYKLSGLSIRSNQASTTSRQNQR